jgi:hypothetical protein
MSTDLDFGIATKHLNHLTNDKDDTLDDNFFGDANVVEVELLPNDVLEDGFVNNPFYVSKNNVVDTMPDAELFSKYKRALALCIRTGHHQDNIFMSQIYNRTIKMSDLNELAKYFTLVPTSIKMLKNKFHRRTALIINRPSLLEFNTSKIVLDNDEIIIPLLTIEENFVHLYNSMYESSYDLNVISIGSVLYKYFNCDTYRTVVLDRLSKIFSDLKETNYWTNPYNCKINLTQKYQERTFRDKETLNKDVHNFLFGQNTGIQDKDAKIVFEKLTKKSNKYEMNALYRKPVYTDVSSVVKVEGTTYKLYRIDNEPLNVTLTHVNDIFNSTTDNKLLFNIFNAFLLSKQHCHLVINNKLVLDKMKPFFTGKFLAFYNYIFGYAWTCFYFEECIVKTRTKYTNRYVFDINTANKLPFFPFTDMNIHLNPYCVLTVDAKAIKSLENFGGIKMISDYKEYGIDTLDGFTTKFNIFTTGQDNKNILDGLETVEGTKKWKHFAVGGSVIPACAQKRSPLVDLITNNAMTYTEKMARFFNEYYNESDIDIMCNSSSVFEFMNNISKLIEVIKKNLNSEVEIEPIKSLIVIVNIKYIEECLKEFGDTKYIIEHIDTPAIKERLYDEYYTRKRQSNNKFRQIHKNNALYESFYKPLQIEDMNLLVTSYEITKDAHYENDNSTYIYLNDILPKDRQAPNNQNILVLKISESIKFKIKSPKMLHNIEAFRVHYEEYFSCVSKFHLPCVRGYYTGDNVYMLPSCVTALMTFTNIDYKYFAGIRDPIDIINKYRVRGFGTILNEQEKANVIEYNSSVPKWKSIFGVDTKNKASVSAHFGSKRITDNMFKPGQFLRNFPGDAYKSPDLNYVSTMEDYYNYYKMNHGYSANACDFLKFSTIGPDGNIQPLKKWVMEAAYEELSK